jgi:apolipoprotein N-acyltransferase
LASVVGVYGLTLAIALSNALLALAWLRWQPLRSAALTASVLLAAAALARLPAPHPSGRPSAFTAGAVQSEASDLDTNLALTAAAAAKGAELVAWPEYSLHDYPLDDPALLSKLRSAARRHRVYVVVGCQEHAAGSSSGAFYNSALVISPSGEVLGAYHKRYPVQFFRDGRPGRDLPTFPTPWGAMGVAICYDMDFAPVLRQLAWRGASFFVVPTYDPMSWGALQHRQHSAMARARAVEHRRYLLRPASSGTSQIIDPWGNVRRCLGIGEEGLVVGELAARQALTPYDRVGWLIPYVCLALVVVLLLYRLVATYGGREGTGRP